MQSISSSASKIFDNFFALIEAGINLGQKLPTNVKAKIDVKDNQEIELQRLTITRLRQ